MPASKLFTSSTTGLPKKVINLPKILYGSSRVTINAPDHRNHKVMPGENTGGL